MSRKIKKKAVDKEQTRISLPKRRSQVSYEQNMKLRSNTIIDSSSSKEDSEESQSSSENMQTKRKVAEPVKREVRKKVETDPENKHYEKIDVVKYSTYKLGNFKNKNMKSFSKDLDIYSLKYMEIASRYSSRSKKKICDFTGLPALFTCPYTRLNYYDSSVFKYIKSLSSDQVTFVYNTREICKNYNPFKNSY